MQTDDQATRLADDLAGLVSALPAEVVDRVQVLLVARHGGGDELRTAAAEAMGPPDAAGVVRSIVKERELARLEQQLGDLADGHVPTTCVATVTVTGRDRDELDRAGLRLTQATTRARVRLGQLHGRQLDGWVWSLPLCRGLGG